MKTPQEESEEMVTTMTPTELRNILAQHIAVARAANGLSMGSDWNHGTHAKEHGYRQQLIDALQSLRATGKVEL